MSRLVLAVVVLGGLVFWLKSVHSYVAKELAAPREKVDFGYAPIVPSTQWTPGSLSPGLTGNQQMPRFGPTVGGGFNQGWAGRR
jgi:hypothetical protein